MKATSIFFKNFKLILGGVLIIQVISVAIYWFLVGKPLALKASAQFVSEMAIVKDKSGYPKAKSSVVWRPIARFVGQKLQEKYQSPIELLKVEENNSIVYFYRIKKTKHIAKLSLNQLDFYSPQAIILSILLVLSASFIIAWMIARKIAIPIHQINRYIQKIGSNSTEIKPNGSNILELDDLISQINWMQGRINLLLHNNQLNYAGFSHDLKTPVTQINLALELIKSEIADKRYTQIKTSLIQLNNRIDDFILQSKTLMAEKKKSIFLSEFILQLVNDLQDNNAQNKINFSCLINKETQTNVFVNRLYRIIENLLKNAQTHGQTTVEIILDKTQSKQVCIYIKDKGEITNNKIAELNNMYQKFWQNLETKTPHAIGTLICHQLVFQSNWKIKYKKNTPKGLSVQITLT
jgi:two-component system osmolarity sensor histidine kinase EnvZ